MKQDNEKQDNETRGFWVIPQRDIKIAKNTVAGLSKRWLARAVPHAVLRCQKSHARSQSGHMVKF